MLTLSLPSSSHFRKLPKPSPSFPPIMATASASDPQPKQRILVIGGGVIGACTAYFLSQKSKHTKITLIEKSSVACAASGKAGGFLALDWCDGGPLSSLARASFSLHRSLSQSLDGPQNYGYRPLTTLSLSVKASSPPPPSSTSLPSWIDGPAAGGPRTIGTVETAAQVHPQLFTRTLVDAAAEEYDLDVVIGEVMNVRVEGGRVTGVEMKGEFVEADAVVLALGPWSARSPILSSLFTVSGLKAHSIVLRPAQPDAITPHALFLSYQDSPAARTLDPEVYPRPTGEVYVCGMSCEAQVPDDPEEIVGDRSSIEMLHKIAGTVSSHLRREGGAEVVAEQACFLPCTEDGVPVIGEVPGVEGCFVGTGHSCWGILNGPATGAALAELVLDGKSSIVDLTPFSPSRFLRLRTRG